MKGAPGRASRRGLFRRSELISFSGSWAMSLSRPGPVPSGLWTSAPVATTSQSTQPTTPHYTELLANFWSVSPAPGTVTTQPWAVLWFLHYFFISLPIIPRTEYIHPICSVNSLITVLLSLESSIKTIDGNTFAQACYTALLY